MNPVDIANVAARHPVRLVLQHGSSVTGRTHARSDLDLAVLFEPGQAGSSALTALTSDLQQACPGEEIDLVVLNHADPLLLKRVLDHCRLVHGQTRTLAEFRLYAFKRYQDHRRFLALERRFVTGWLTRVGAP